MLAEKQVVLDKQVRSEMPPESQIHLHFMSNEFAVRRALAQLMQRLQKTRLTADELGQVELVVAEVLNNIVEHAYGPSQPGPVDLTCDLLSRQIRVIVVDQGRDVPVKLLYPRRPTDPRQFADNLPEGGWGWALIHSLTDTISYSKCDGANLLYFTVAVAPL